MIDKGDYLEEQRCHQASGSVVQVREVLGLNLGSLPQVYTSLLI